jgi:hypothetical protein
MRTCRDPRGRADLPLVRVLMWPVEVYRGGDGGWHVEG